MKPINESRPTSSYSDAATSFAISDKDAGVVMGLLADGIYTDKVLAVLREYSANAWDAHRMVGKGSVPIRVTLPMREDNTLRIRDFGPGLSHDDVFNIYTRYGASTKRNTNDAVGCLGIGSKSGFAYSDTFTITSFHDGWARIYVALMGDDGGSLSLMSSEPSDETGVEISITTKPEDRYEFENKARTLFRHFTPRPEINIILPSEPTEQTILVNGAIYGQGQGWIAKMGCVPYRVNIQQLDQQLVSKCLHQISGCLHFDIGEVQISASREELRYSSGTKTKLIQKFNDLVDEYVLHALTTMESLSEWDRRLKVQVLDAMSLPLPEEYQDLTFVTAKITYLPGTFTLLHGSSVATRINVNTRTRILIDDTGKTLSHYYLTSDDYVARSEKTPDETRVMVSEALMASGLNGCKIELLSTIQYNAPWVKPKKVVNPKHRARMFTLGTSCSSTKSDNWELVDRVPLDTDIFVIIQAFQVVGDSSFFSHVHEDRQLAEHFGITFPAVYGYKTSNVKPVDTSKIKGISYEVWRRNFIVALQTPGNLTLIQSSFWRTPGDQHSWPSARQAATLISDLGTEHPISKLITAQSAAKASHALVTTLARRAGITEDASAAGKAWADVLARYPLLKGRNFDNLWSTYSYDGYTAADFVDYVKMVDERALRSASAVIKV